MSPRPGRSGWSGEVGALHRDARCTRGGRRRGTCSATRSRTGCSTSTSCPSSSGGCGSSPSTGANVVSLRDGDHFDGAAPLKQAVLELAGDPSIERVLMLTPAARARLRVQPGHVLLVLPRRRLARLHRLGAEQHVRRAAARGAARAGARATSSASGCTSRRSSGSTRATSTRSRSPGDEVWARIHVRDDDGAPAAHRGAARAPARADEPLARRDARSATRCSRCR